MPRVTKRQKEAGHPKAKAAAAAKPGAKPYTRPSGGAPGGRPSKPSFSPGGKPGGRPGPGGKPSYSGKPAKGGFKVGPAHAPKDAYLGKARKIKAELIQRAKVKKAYAKVLAEEGMSSARLGRKPATRMADSDSEDDEVARRRERSPSSSPLPDVDGRRARSPSSSPLPGDDNDSDGSDDEGAAFAAAMRAELRGERPEGSARGAKSERPKFEKRERPAERTFEKREKRDFKPKTGKPDLRKGSKFKEHTAKARPVARALSPEKTKVVVDQAAFRAKKKEAFGKHHHVGSKRGQPNMAARMDVLLDKIRMGK